MSVILEKKSEEQAEEEDIKKVKEKRKEGAEEEKVYKKDELVESENIRTGRIEFAIYRNAIKFCGIFLFIGCLLTLAFKRVISNLQDLLISVAY